jgi:hypothetical protein
MAKSGRDVKRRFSKIEKRSTGAYVRVCECAVEGGTGVGACVCRGKGGGEYG